MEGPDFFVIKKVGNRAVVDTYTFDPMLLQFCVTIATLINILPKIAILRKVFRKFCLKTTMIESHIFLFNKPLCDILLFNKLLLMVAIMDKYFQCAIRLIFKSIWCYSFDLKYIESATSHA